MPHEKIAQLAGSSHVLSMRGNPVDHCCKSTAGMERGIEGAEEKVTEELIPKHRRY